MSTMMTDGLPLTNEEIAARLAALEQAQAAKEAAGAVEAQRRNAPPAPAVRTRFANVAEEQQDRARLARVRAHEAEVEAARLQAIKDAPKLAKREKALAAYDEQMLALDSEYEDRKRRIAADRFALSRSPL